MRTARVAALPFAALVWVFIILATPLAASSPSARHGVFVVYRAASLVCHQKSERSFALAGSQMPVCGRCFGLYAAGAVGALAALLVGRRSASDPLVRVIILAIAALPMGFSVGLELVGLVQGTNIIRFASALPLGVVAGWLMEQVLLDEYRPAFAAPDNRPAI
jgi:uncharacterized membrane protein